MKKIAIIGASVAGISAGRELRRLGYDGDLVIVGAESEHPYDRTPLSKGFLQGLTSQDELGLLASRDAGLSLTLMLGSGAVRLDVRDRSVELDSGARVKADGFVIATGAEPVPWPGRTLQGCYSLRSLEDAVNLKRALQPGARLVVIGGGFIGCEVAASGSLLGLQVTIVSMGGLLRAALGRSVAMMCASLHQEHGVDVVLGARATHVFGQKYGHATSNVVSGVELSNGTRIPADVVVLATGVRPNTEWLHGSSVDCDNGVIANSMGMTSVPNIVAAGDCARPYDPSANAYVRSEHWMSALRKSENAARALLGADEIVGWRPPYFWSDQFGHRLQFAGDRSDIECPDIVDGAWSDRSLVAVYRHRSRPVAVFAMDRGRDFSRWRRKLSQPEYVP